MNRSLSEEHRGPECSLLAEKAWERSPGEKNRQGKLFCPSGTSLPRQDRGACIGELTTALLKNLAHLRFCTSLMGDPKHLKSFKQDKNI